MFMDQICMENLISTLENWPTIIVRCVPGVMYQVLCQTNDIDNGMEYRFHWFLDCTETFVHNHGNAFDTFCLEGQYLEKLWAIIDDDDDAITYKFSRTSGNKFGSIVHIPGSLRHVASRHHFPGNVLHVDTNQFHSITPGTGSDKYILTFVARHKCLSSAPNTYILSPSKIIAAPIDEIISATLEERLAVYHKLQQIFLSL
jgi:hypothetical protein